MPAPLAMRSHLKAGNLQGDCEAMRGLRPSELTTSGALRASRRPTAPEGAGWRPDPPRTPRSRADHALPSGAAARSQRHRPHRGRHRTELPRFIKNEFRTCLECGILAHGILRLRCGECGLDKLLAFRSKRCGLCPSFSARRMSQTAAHLVDQVIPRDQALSATPAMPAGCGGRVRPLRAAAACSARRSRPVAAWPIRPGTVCSARRRRSPAASAAEFGG